MENKKINELNALMDLDIGSEIAELELLAASCRVPTPTSVRLGLHTEEEEDELGELSLEPEQ